MDRVWLLTWSMYGTWLPGDDRGFVSNVAGEGGRGRRRNARGSTPEASLPGLAEVCKATLTGPPVRLTADQAGHVLAQFYETAAYRGWVLLAAAVMANHIHIVVGVDGDPEPDLLLRDFKSYASRRLNRLPGATAGGRWWTEGGSRRKLPDPTAVEAAVAYVEQQEHSLASWSINPPGERPA